MKKKEFALKNNIKKIRTEKGLTQTELAKLAKTNQNSISAIENGSFPTLYLALLISEALEVPVQECFKLEK